MQRRSVAIAVIAAAIVVFAGAVGLLRVERPGERMVARAPLLPRPSVDGVRPAGSGLPNEPQRSDTRPTDAGAVKPSAPATSPGPAPVPAAAVGSAPPADQATAVPAPPLGDLRHADPAAAPQAASREAPPAPATEPATTPRPDPPPKAAAPSFDIVRVEPNGDTLVAGRAAPDSVVALTDRDKTVAETRTDAAGNFVLTPPTLPSGDHALGLREGQGGRTVESQQSVVVSVPRSRSQQVVVALAEPNQPTRLLSAPPAAPSAPLPSGAGPTPSPPASSPPASSLAIRSVELENGSGLFASGVAPPGTDVRLYLNDSRVADVIAAAAGAWTVTVRRGLTAGRYAVRADSLKPDQSVAARVEVPFDVPPAAMGRRVPETSEQGAKAVEMPSDTPRPAVASTPSSIAGATAPPIDAIHTAAAPDTPHGATANNAVVDELQTELVTRGDNLWRISRKRLGFGTRYTQIYAANATQIRDPRLIYPGQVFVMPQ